MWPQVQSVFLNWMDTVQMKVIKQAVVDFEPQDDVLAVLTFDAVIQAISPKVVSRKPENERAWKWWEMWTTVKIESDTVIQDPNGAVFRVASTQDWSQGGFFHSEMTEQPRGDN